MAVSSDAPAAYSSTQACTIGSHVATYHCFLALCLLVAVWLILWLVLPPWLLVLGWFPLLSILHTGLAASDLPPMRCGPACLPVPIMVAVFACLLTHSILSWAITTDCSTAQGACDTGKHHVPVTETLSQPLVVNWFGLLINFDVWFVFIASHLFACWWLVPSFHSSTPGPPGEGSLL